MYATGSRMPIMCNLNKGVANDPICADYAE